MKTVLAIIVALVLAAPAQAFSPKHPFGPGKVRWAYDYVRVASFKLPNGKTVHVRVRCHVSRLGRTSCRVAP